MNCHSISVRNSLYNFVRKCPYICCGVLPIYCCEILSILLGALPILLGALPILMEVLPVLLWGITYIVGGITYIAYISGGITCNIARGITYIAAGYYL